MINTLISFADEDRALMELEPFGYAHIVAPPEGETGGEVVYAWNQGTAMVGGAGIILSYKQQTVPGPGGGDITVNVPTVAPGFWVSLLSEELDEELWEQMSANYPAIEFSAEGTRTANLTFDINTIKGVSPVWGGMPDMGWPYDG